MKLVQKIRRFKPYIAGLIFIILGSLPANSAELSPTPLSRRHEQHTPHRLAGNKDAENPRCNLPPWSEPIKDTRARMGRVKKLKQLVEDFDSDSEDEIQEFPKTDQCGVFKIKSRIKEDIRLVRLAENGAKDQKVQRGLNALIEQLRLGNDNPGLGTKPLFRNVKEARARGGGRVCFVKKGDTYIILGKSGKQPQNQQAVITILREKYE